jgi:hypothetical protein
VSAFERLVRDPNNLAHAVRFLVKKLHVRSWPLSGGVKGFESHVRASPERYAALLEGCRTANKTEEKAHQKRGRTIGSLAATPIPNARPDEEPPSSKTLILSPTEVHLQSAEPAGMPRSDLLSWIAKTGRAAFASAGVARGTDPSDAELVALGVAALLYDAPPMTANFLCNTVIMQSADDICTCVQPRPTPFAHHPTCTQRSGQCERTPSGHPRKQQSTSVRRYLLPCV